MELTPNLNLKKPAGTDIVNINDFNDNADALDSAIANKVDKISGKQLSTEDYTSAEKTKLSGIAAGANNYSHPTSDGNKHVPANGTTNTNKVLKASATAGTYSWGSVAGSEVTEDSTHRFATDAEKTAWNAKAEAAEATTSTAGLMSSSDKTKLNGIATGSNNYTHPSGDGNLHVPATSTTNSGKVLKAGSTAGSLSWGTLAKTDVGLGSVDNAQQATKTEFNTHLADYVRQPGYGATAGSANIYTLTLSPAPTAYVDGMGVVVKVNVANTGAATINVNGLGAKTIVDGKGSALTSGKLRLNGIYSLKYSTTSGNFQLVGEGGEYGTAGAAQVLSGYTIGTDNGLVAGTIPSKGAQTYTPGATAQTVAAGQYLSGAQTISAVNFNASKVLAGTAIAGTAGTCSPKVPNLIKNGNFSSASFTNWKLNGAAWSSVSGNKLIFKATSQWGGINQNLPFYALNEKIYIRCYIKAATSVRIYYEQYPGWAIALTNVTTANTWQYISGLAPITGGESGQYTASRFLIQDTAASGWANIEVTNIMFINLTRTFGAGKEPTKDEMDAIVTANGGWWDNPVSDLADATYLPGTFFPKIPNLIRNGLINNWQGGWIVSGSGNARFGEGDGCPVSNDVMILWGGPRPESLLSSHTGIYRQGHIYYISAWFKSDAVSAPIQVYFPGGDSVYAPIESTGYATTSPTAYAWRRQSYISIRTDLGYHENCRLRFDNDNGNTDRWVMISGIMLLDLTEAFGAGNEPTKEMVDRVVDMHGGYWGDMLWDYTQAANLDPKYLAEGQSGYDDGVLKAGTMPNRPAWTNAVATSIDGNNLHFLFPLGAYTSPSSGENASVWANSAHWVESNIKSGANIFGKTGTFNGRQSAGGTGTRSGNMDTLAVSGLSFTPSRVTIKVNNAHWSNYPIFISSMPDGSVVASCNAYSPATVGRTVSASFFAGGFSIVLPQSDDNMDPAYYFDYFCTE